MSWVRSVQDSPSLSLRKRPDVTWAVCRVARLVQNLGHQLGVFPPEPDRPECDEQDDGPGYVVEPAHSTCLSRRPESLAAQIEYILVGHRSIEVDLIDVLLDGVTAAIREHVHLMVASRIHCSV